jgi:uncharacterized membrane protein YdjX (TVP38/TMEM64 family)
MDSRKHRAAEVKAAPKAPTPDDAQSPSEAGKDSAKGISRAKVLIGIAVVAIVLGAYGILSWTGALTVFTDAPTLERLVVELGLLGPLAIIGLLAVAIVFNPIPSAPIALVAGAAYGHFWGTFYVVIGAEIGALMAFSIARLVGYEVLRKWLGDRLSLGHLTSQNALMALVFASRLLPFISFDLVSYAAGLTPLTAWRFAVATLAGIIPASFLLTHFGGEMASADARRITIAVLALGTITLVPIVAKVLLDLYRARRR